MSDFYYHPCPRCQSTGTIDYYSLTTRGVEMGLQTRQCDCCDGTGKLKLPWGFELTPQTQAATITTSWTNTQPPS